MPGGKLLKVTFPPVVGIFNCVEKPSDGLVIEATHAEQSVEVGTLTVMEAFEKQVPFVFVTVKLAELHCAILCKENKESTKSAKPNFNLFILFFYNFICFKTTDNQQLHCFIHQNLSGNKYTLFFELIM